MRKKEGKNIDAPHSAPKKRLDYRWVVIAVCFLMVFTCLGFCSSNKGLYLSAITKALGIGYAIFSALGNGRDGVILHLP